MNDRDDYLEIEQAHPALRQLIKDFLRKCKYPYKMLGAGRHIAVESGVGREFFPEMVLFMDPNAETMNYAGAIKWQQGDFGKPYKFRVVTRYVINQRYRDSERKRSVETQDEARALKEMLTHFKPFTTREIAHEHRSAPVNVVSAWKSEFYSEMNLAFSLTNDIMVREILNLQAQGVKFATEEFNNIATKGIEAYNETQRRQQVKTVSHFVRVLPDGRVLVLSQGGVEPVEYMSYDHLPDFMKETISMLRLMKEETPRLAGVGARVSKNCYWVIVRDE